MNAMNELDKLIVVKMNYYKTKFEKRKVDNYYGPTAPTVDKLKEFGDGITLYQKSEGDGYTRSFITKFVICPKSKIEEGKVVLLRALIEDEEGNLKKLMAEHKKSEDEQIGKIKKLNANLTKVINKLGNLKKLVTEHKKSEDEQIDKIKKLNANLTKAKNNLAKK